MNYKGTSVVLTVDILLPDMTFLNQSMMSQVAVSTENARPNRCASVTSSGGGSLLPFRFTTTSVPSEFSLVPKELSSLTTPIGWWSDPVKDETGPTGN
jgi:hypothetical protein